MKNEQINIEEIKQAIEDNTLYFLRYRDNKSKYQNVYEVKKSDAKKIISKYTKYSRMSIYHLSMYVDDVKDFIDMGRIHPLDLLHIIAGHKDEYMILEVEMK